MAMLAIQLPVLGRKVSFFRRKDFFRCSFDIFVPVVPCALRRVAGTIDGNVYAGPFDRWIRRVECSR
jgi:hypothetical protein